MPLLTIELRNDAEGKGVSFIGAESVRIVAGQGGLQLQIYRLCRKEDGWRTTAKRWGVFAVQEWDDHWQHLRPCLPPEWRRRGKPTGLYPKITIRPSSPQELRDLVKLKGSPVKLKGRKS